MTGQTIWFLSIAILLGAVAVGRFVGIAFDGFDRVVIPPLVVELVMVSVLIAAHLMLPTA